MKLFTAATSALILATLLSVATTIPAWRILYCKYYIVWGLNTVQDSSAPILSGPRLPTPKDGAGKHDQTLNQSFWNPKLFGDSEFLYLSVLQLFTPTVADEFSAHIVHNYV
ncbi:hypothetical protein BDQ17DRAFT_1334026 [Cyathus striatus]|nr:hypothetical protein BDQ17DRAFT_1334026 [Cyathus striatus]